jgi:zinc/manganese transport system permease protein
MISQEMIEIVAPALVAGVMIALTHAPLGLEVLKRGIIFMDLAVAQIAGLGLVIMGIVFQHPSNWLMQLGALAFAITAGLVFRYIETIKPKQLEAIIGCSFVLSASLSLLLLANQPHGGEEIQHLLSGQILFVTWHNVLSHAWIYALILAIWFIKPSVRTGIGFYILFAMAITSSVQLVGVYVVFASLILPALAASTSQHKHRSAWAYGVSSVLLGIITATVFDLPAGPIIVIAYASVTAVSLFVKFICQSMRHPKELT